MGLLKPEIEKSLSQNAESDTPRQNSREKEVKEVSMITQTYINQSRKRSGLFFMRE